MHQVRMWVCRFDRWKYPIMKPRLLCAWFPWRFRAFRSWEVGGSKSLTAVPPKNSGSRIQTHRSSASSSKTARSFPPIYIPGAPPRPLGTLGQLKPARWSDWWAGSMIQGWRSCAFAGNSLMGLDWPPRRGNAGSSCKKDEIPWKCATFCRLSWAQGLACGWS